MGPRSLLTVSVSPRPKPTDETMSPSPRGSRPGGAPLAGPSRDSTGLYESHELGGSADRPTDPALEVVYLEPKALQVERKGAAPLVVTLYPDRTYIFGRAPEATLVFPSEAVSRIHGQLHYRADARWVYRDLNSSNGSFALKDQPPHAPIVAGKERVVRSGDTILLGNQQSRLVFLPEVPAAAGRGPGAAGGASVAATRLTRSVEVCARHRLPVFLLGPSGSGKTFIARSIHERSQLSGQFVLINCGRLPEDAAQLTSELLGHVKGGFTGALSARMGKFESAHQGTLFLDEVESLPRIAQDFLLDVLDGSGNFAPLGAPADLRVPPPRFRLISASKQTLSGSALRPDLAQRLAGDLIVLPTLDERREDIPRLARAFLAQLKDEQRIAAELSAEALAFLQAASWPGQIRELESTIKVVVSREHASRELDGARGEPLVIGISAVKAYLAERKAGFGAARAAVGRPPPLRTGTRKRPADLTRGELEQALREAGGNKTHAAQALGIAVNTLKARMRALKLG